MIFPDDIFAQPMSVPIFLFTIPTHWASAIAALFMAHILFNAPEVNTYGLILTWLFSMLPDFIDNPQSRPGMVFSGFVKLISAGRWDIGRYVEHRGFWHSFTALALMTAIAYLIWPSAAPYLFLGMGSHIFFDGFQEKGISLLGFGEWRGRISKKAKIPSGRQEEFYFMAATLIPIFVGAWLVAEGGTKPVICKYLGTVECTARMVQKHRAEGKATVLLLQGASHQSGGGPLSGEFHEPEAIGMARIVFWKDGIPYSLGNSEDDNFIAGRSSFIKVLGEAKACRFAFQIRGKTLGSLKDFIDASLPYYRISGNVLLSEAVNLKIFHNRYNSISGKGRQLKLTAAKLPDIEAYEIENALIETADLELVYYAKGNEPCRFDPPKDVASAEIYTQHITLRLSASLLMGEGDSVNEGMAIAEDPGIDEQVRLLREELLTEKSRLERRELALARHKEKYLAEGKELAPDLMLAGKYVERLKQFRRASGHQLLRIAGLSLPRSVTGAELQAAAKRVSGELLERLEKEHGQMKEKLERSQESHLKDLRELQDLKEKYALEVQKKKAEIADLKNKREIHAAVSGKVLRIEKSSHNDLVKVKILILVGHSEVLEN